MELKHIPLTEISSNPFRPRQTIKQDKLLGLADCLRKYKIITPLLVAKTPAGLQLVSGERRLRAAKIAGFQKVPCVVITGLDPVDFAFLSLSENLQNEPLNILEQAGVLQKLRHDYQLSAHQMAENLGLEEEQVEKMLKTIELPDQIKAAYLKGEISDQSLLKLVSIEGHLELMDKFNILREQQAQVD